MLTTAVVLLLVTLLALGVPIAFSMAIAGTVGLFFGAGWQHVAGILGEVVYVTVSNYVLLTIPMFILMSEFLAISGVARDLVNASNLWLGRLHGGLAMACITAGALLAAVVGSSSASAATMSRAAFPDMRRLGYKDSFSLGVISIAGTLAILIPPSLALIIYGVLTEESIGKLLIAGIIPGILTAFGYIVTIFIMVRRNPSLAPRSTSFDLGAALRASRPIWPVVLLMLIVMGTLYSGVATPTEVGAIGALAAMLIPLLQGRLGAAGIVTALRRTVKTTVMIMMIITGAMIFGYFMAFVGLTQGVITALSQSALTPWTIMLLVIAIYLVLGMFLDQFAILVLTIPLTYALITKLGFDGIWFGIIVTKTVEIGLVSPPVGLNVFITSSITGVPLREAFTGVLPFIVTELVVTAILLAFPEISLFLPHLMK